MNLLSLCFAICSFHLILAIPDNFNAVDPEDTYARKNAIDYPGFLLKRAPSGFFGMRGKKLSYDGIKRAPYGFTGMRGKKSDMFDDENRYSINGPDFYELLIKVQNQLNSIRQINDENALYDSEIAPGDSISTGKRAPSGFMGMRGKKTFD